MIFQILFAYMAYMQLETCIMSAFVLPGLSVTTEKNGVRVTMVYARRSTCWSWYISLPMNATGLGGEEEALFCFVKSNHTTIMATCIHILHESKNTNATVYFITSTRIDT